MPKGFSFLQSPAGQVWLGLAMTQQAQLNISATARSVFTIVFPPLPEQQRIVAKLDELMAHCDRLEARLTRAREKSAHLAASVVHHLIAA
jgi:type I restriction enzyme, S subunit